jgi:hypothetical protein
MSLQLTRPDIQLSLIHPNELKDVVEYFHDKHYYVYRGDKYHISFPERWAIKFKFGTGYDCDTCIQVARFRGVLYGYCDTCAIQEYKGRRGSGVHYLAYERFDIDDPSFGPNDYSIHMFSDKKFYIFRGKKFHYRFPQEWAINQAPLTGHSCGACITSAMFRNVLIGYCNQCAERVYNNKRGYGFNKTLQNLERNVENASFYYSKLHLWWSANTASIIIAPYLGIEFKLQDINPL